MKKYSILVGAALATMTAFTSCDDANECGCSCGMPVIENVEKLDDPDHASIVGNVEAGSYIAIHGSNLGNVTAIRFGEKTVNVRAAYRSDNQIILQVPTVTHSCQGVLVTDKCPEGYANAALSIVIGAPNVLMMYNEFAADGADMMLKGSSFVGDQMQVDFLLTNGTVATVGGSDIKLIGDNGDEMYVKVPLGAAPSQYVVVRNAAEGKETICPYMFRDMRNMLADFDTHNEFLANTASIEKDADGVYSIANGAAELPWVMSVAPNYSLNPVNNFGVFASDDWKAINYAPDWNNDQDDIPSVFGPFLESLKADPSTVANYAVKFEINVPAEYPTTYLVYTLGFTSADDVDLGNSRAFCAGLQMSKINWDKSDPDLGWQFASADKFSTGGKWMTVTVPMSEFMWNFVDMSYPSFAQNISEGDFGNAELQKAFGNENHSDYGSAHSGDFAKASQIYKNWGGFQMQVNPYDGPKNSDNFGVTNPNAARVAIDNIRIVPNDGNGAIYPKTKFGVPSQHYYDNPKLR